LVEGREDTAPTALRQRLRKHGWTPAPERGPRSKFGGGFLETGPGPMLEQLEGPFVLEGSRCAGERRCPKDRFTDIWTLALYKPLQWFPAPAPILDPSLGGGGRLAGSPGPA